MTERSTLAATHRTARNAAGSRATVREFDDKHLVQQVKFADVFHSETPSDFERFQMVGLTSVPLKQEETQQKSSQQQSSQQQSSGNYDGSDDQPTGKSSEMLMNYVNGSRSHPVGGLCDDRRVRPYAMKEGETACYAASGTGQMLFHNNSGSYLIAVNNPPEQSKNNQETERFASLRHVTKSKQKREIKEGEQVQEHKHEGESVNTEVRCTSGRIEFRVGDKVVGYYDKQSDAWYFTSKIHTRNATEEVKDTSPKISHN